MNDGRSAKDRHQLLLGILGYDGRIEIAPHPLGEEVGAKEGPFHRKLLVEEHAQEEGKAALGEQPIGVLISSPRQTLD